MWVFTYKLDKDGFVIKYKARLIIQGDLQVLQFKDTYIATLATRVFRALIAIIAFLIWISTNSMQLTLFATLRLIN